MYLWLFVTLLGSVSGFSLVGLNSFDVNSERPQLVELEGQDGAHTAFSISSSLTEQLGEESGAIVVPGNRHAQMMDRFITKLCGGRFRKECS